VAEPTNYVSRMRQLIRREFPKMPDDLVEINTALALTKGTGVTMRDAHDTWAVHMNKVDPTHEDLVPFAMLDAAEQEKDRKYMEGIHRAVWEYQAELMRAFGREKR
jgi:hypothetical protein